MSDERVSCTGCNTALPETVLNRQEPSHCPACGASLWVEVFPALFKNPVVGQAGEALLVDGESSCFYHTQKKAHTPCDACGRFLCALCDLEFNGQHLCPRCLESGKTKGKLRSLENHRTLYDSAALWMAILPLLVFPFVAVTGPIAVFVAVRYWNEPGSIIRRSRVRSVIAIFLGLIESFGGAFFWFTALQG